MVTVAGVIVAARSRAAGIDSLADSASDSLSSSEEDAKGRELGALLDEEGAAGAFVSFSESLSASEDSADLSLLSADFESVMNLGTEAATLGVGFSSESESESDPDPEAESLESTGFFCTTGDFAAAFGFSSSDESSSLSLACASNCWIIAEPIVQHLLAFSRSTSVILSPTPALSAWLGISSTYLDAGSRCQARMSSSSTISS